MIDVSSLSRFNLGDMTVEFLLDQISQSVGLRLFPAALADQVAAHREQLSDQRGGPVWHLEPLVQAKLLGDPIQGYSQGSTMRNSATVDSLRLEEQTVATQGDQTTIITRLASQRGYALENCITWRAGEQAVRVNSAFHNRSEVPLTLEMLSSFSLSGITPFAMDDAPQRLYVHRFRSAWSAEGRHEYRLAEAAGLERSWAQHAVRAERFGQVGSLPVKGLFPWAGVEDRERGVFWGAQLAQPGSWQMEFYWRDDFLCLSGGLADREFGHWLKTVAPGEQIASPFAYLSTVQGDLDDLCARLVNMQLPAAEAVPACELDLPVIFNEYCYSWGDPHHDDLVAMAERLEGSGVKYLVIDAGWYKGDEGSWHLAQGDWVASPRLFPHGLAATAEAIRRRGLTPGLWFEMEVVGEQSARFHQDLAHCLHRDGLPLTLAGRHFWDFRDPWVIDYLSQKVIGLLRDTGIGYIKVDYNETIGMGCDGAESPGEGLRQHLEGVQGFFAKMRAELPDLVIENCASGGHRLEPSMMALSSMSSFSDAHETRDIPVIAANLHRLILPRQSQIWAVLHAADSSQRLVYLLSAGFLGRLCLSGEVATLNDEQFALAKEAIGFYRQLAPLIARGKSKLLQAVGPSWQHLQGAQAVLRLAEDEQRAIVVAHSFGAPLPAAIHVPLPGPRWQAAGCFPATAPVPELAGNELRYRPLKEWEGHVISLIRS
jgi:alpha-galactosidase